VTGICQLSVELVNALLDVSWQRAVCCGGRTRLRDGGTHLSDSDTQIGDLALMLGQKPTRVCHLVLNVIQALT